MKVPSDKYTLESFLEYVVNHPEDVFQSGKPKRLKGHLLYVEKDWKGIFGNLNLENFGDITHIAYPSSNSKDIFDFYGYEWAPGLIMIFTSSTEDIYERTLKQFIEKRRGISQAWIKPSVLEQLKNYLVEKYEAKIYRFISRRYAHWKVPAQLRPEEDRRISYSGDDAGQTLKEVQSLYGVIPTSIDFMIDGARLKISRSGLFALGETSLKTTGILRELVDKVIAEQIVIRNTSEKFNAKYKNIHIGKNDFLVPQLVAGKIVLPNMKLSELMIRGMFSQVNGTTELSDEEDELEKGFSFVDTYVREGPFFFSATVVDENKGTVFGLSGIEDEIALIPKHRTTFETFIKFYNAISDNFDETAQLTTFSEELHA